MLKIMQGKKNQNKLIEQLIGSGEASSSHDTYTNIDLEEKKSKDPYQSIDVPLR